MAQLGASGRCCGRKPLKYVRAPRHLFCPRCDRAYDIETGAQMLNWAWQMWDGQWRSATSSAEREALPGPDA